MKTSLSVYIDFATMSRSFLVSALNSLDSFLLKVACGYSTSISIS